MKNLFLNLIPTGWLEAIGMTLFHSLWLGIILSVLTGIVIISTRKSTAALRYNLLTGCLVLFIIAIGFVFFKEISIKPASVVQQQVTSLSLAKPLPSTASLSSVPPSSTSLDQSVTEVQNSIFAQVSYVMYLWNSYSNVIVLLWFLVICAKSIQLMISLQSISYLKRTHTYDAGRLWETKVTELADRMGIRQQLRIVQSGIAKVPMVAGNLKPLILIPLGMLNGLKSNEVEAILMHELAHIKRRDYLVNIFQSFTEVVFFFNPGVMWLSDLIREERENCCDDLAIGCIGDKTDYVKALVSCHEFEFNAPELVMALAQSKNLLRNRVKRVLLNKTTSFNKAEKMILSFILITVVLFSAAFTPAERATEKTFGGIAGKTFKRTLETSIKERINNEITINLSQDTIKKVKPKKAIAKKVNPKRSYKKHVMAEEAASARKEADLASKEAISGRKEVDLARQEVVSARKEADLARQEVVSIRKKADLARQEAVLARKEADLARQEAMSVRKQAQLEQTEAKISRKETNGSRIKLSRKYSVNGDNVYMRIENGQGPVPPSAIAGIPSVPRVPSVPGVPPAVNAVPAPPAVNSIPMPPSINSIPTPPAVPAFPSAAGKKHSKYYVSRSVELTDVNGSSVNMNNSRIEQLNKELLKDGIVSQLSKLSYRLNKNELIVNGVKQSEPLHEKYKSGYLLNNKGSLVYNYEIRPIK